MTTQFHSHGTSSVHGTPSVRADRDDDTVSLTWHIERADRDNDAASLTRHVERARNVERACRP